MNILDTIEAALHPAIIRIVVIYVAVMMTLLYLRLGDAMRAAANDRKNLMTALTGSVRDRNKMLEEQILGHKHTDTE